MYQVITRDDRLDLIAKDVVEHFMNRGFMGKAMYVAIDKATAIKIRGKPYLFTLLKSYFRSIENI